MILFILVAICALYCLVRLANGLVDGIFRAVVTIVKLPWYLGVGVWRAALLMRRFQLWCESRYVAAERRARGV